VGERARHRDDLAFERRELGELEGVQGVVEQVAPVDLDDEVLEIGSARGVHEAEQPGTVHGGLARLAPPELHEDLGGGNPSLVHGAGSDQSARTADMPFSPTSIICHAVPAWKGSPARNRIGR